MRPRWQAAAAALLLLLSLLLLFALWSGRDPGPSPGEAVRPASGAQEKPARAVGLGGIPARPSDLSAAARVAGEVVDEDGAVVGEGALHFACLRGDEVEAIPDAAVRLDEAGRFDAATCRDTVCATFHHPYLVPAEPWVLRPGTEQTLVARPLARLWGSVLTASGDPAVAANVTFLPPKGSEDDPTAFIPLASHSTTTDADGTFSVAWIERPPCGPCDEALGRCKDAEPLPVFGSLRAVVSAPGAAPLTVDVDAETRPGRSPDDPLIIALSPAADLLTGSLLDPEGIPYPRAYVIARSVERRHDQRRAEVVKGNFEVDGLGEGTYSLRAIQDGIELATGEANAGDDVELRGELRADGPSLVVQVLGPDKRPFAGATVDGGPFRGARTDMKGQVRAANALAGKVAIRVRAGGASAREEITVEEGAQRAESIDLQVQLRTLPASAAHATGSPGRLGGVRGL